MSRVSLRPKRSRIEFFKFGSKSKGFATNHHRPWVLLPKPKTAPTNRGLQKGTP